MALNESMTVSIRGYEEPPRNILDLAFHIERQLRRVPQFKQAKRPEVITIDGTTNFNSRNGTINFYSEGIPDSAIPNILKGIQFYLDEFGAKHGQFSKDISKAFGGTVYRIDIEMGTATDMPPHINLSNSNARMIFGDVLGLSQHESDNGFYKIPIHDLLIKLNTLASTDFSKGVHPSTITKEKGKATYIAYGYNQETLQRILDDIHQIANWAIANNYDFIDVV
jgi:hypothetical protein